MVTLMPNTTPPWQRRSRQRSGGDPAPVAEEHSNVNDQAVGEPIALEAPHPPTETLRSTPAPDYEPQDVGAVTLDDVWSETPNATPEPTPPPEPTQTPEQVPAPAVPSSAGAGPVPIEPRQPETTPQRAPQSWFAVVIAVIALAVALGTVLIGDDEPASTPSTGIATAVSDCVDAQDTLLADGTAGSRVHLDEDLLADLNRACQKAESIAAAIGD